MSEQPQVTFAKDGREHTQWGKGYFFRRDGGKTTLNGKRAAIGFAGFFVVVTCISLTDNSNTSLTSSPPIEVPSTIVPITLAAPETPLVAEKKSKGAKGVRSRITARVYSAPQVIRRPRSLASIPPGLLVKAVLTTGASNGPVRAELRENVIAGGEIVIDSGSALLGSGSSSEDRLLLHFNQVVFKDDTFAPIQADACDITDKVFGLKGSKVGNRALNLAGSIGLGFVGGIAEGFQETTGQQGVLVRKPNLKNALLNASRETAFEQSRNLMADLKSRNPPIEVPEGREIYLLFGDAK